ncbi:tetratricopeptide repeat protein [Aliidiomarina sp. B3213]|nr:SEL1-like repeat protein [Aliidiomarina sp. B3213]RTE86461.1 sel1 repeat family protein [Aliidiomarina sp. B3213]
MSANEVTVSEYCGTTNSVQDLISCSENAIRNVSAVYAYQVLERCTEDSADCLKKQGQLVYALQLEQYYESMLSKVEPYVTAGEPWALYLTALLSAQFGRYEEAKLLIEPFLESGDLDAALNTSEILRMEQKYHQAYLTLSEAMAASESGDTNERAIMALGQYYQYGLGVQTNLERALELYSSIDGGDLFGSLEHLISGVYWELNDSANTISYLESSLRRGFGLSARFLGDIYFVGQKDVDQDYRVAAQYYNEAAARGLEGAMFMQGLALIRAGEVRKGRISVIAAGIMESDPKAIEMLNESDVDYRSFTCLVEEEAPYGRDFLTN